ncbi:uncharacterized protein J3R85_009544, partial [Psidium guajava]
ILRDPKQCLRRGRANRSRTRPSQLGPLPAAAATPPSASLHVYDRSLPPPSPSPSTPSPAPSRPPSQRRGGGSPNRRAGQGWGGQRGACRVHELGFGGKEEAGFNRFWIEIEGQGRDRGGGDCEERFRCPRKSCKM